jgi:hypothetical protein
VGKSLVLKNLTSRGRGDAVGVDRYCTEVRNMGNGMVDSKVDSVQSMDKYIAPRDIQDWEGQGAAMDRTSVLRKVARKERGR